MLRERLSKCLKPRSIPETAHYFKMTSDEQMRLINELDEITAHNAELVLNHMEDEIFLKIAGCRVCQSQEDLRQVETKTFFATFCEQHYPHSAVLAQQKPRTLKDIFK